MAIPDGAILRVVSNLSMPENVTAQNVYYTTFADTGTSDSDADVMSDLALWVDDMITQIQAELSDEVSATTMKIYIYDPIDEDWDEVGQKIVGRTGTSVSDMLAHGVAAVIHAKTTDPDVQAAKFVPGFSEIQTTDGLFLAGALSALADYADAWTDPFVGVNTGGDFGPGVWSQVRELFYLFNQVEIVNAIPGYQRRRKPGVGI